MTTFRKLLPTERQLYRTHLHRLGEADRYARFTGMVSKESLDRHADKLDWSKTLLLGALDRGDLVGAVELCTDRTLWPREAELAVSVLGGQQSRGIGSVLVRRALTAARNRGIRRVHVLCLPDNRRMRALLQRLGAQVTVEPDEVTAVIDLPRPDHLSLALEAWEDGGGLVSAAIDRLRVRSALHAA